MFEHFSEKARRVVFFARYEASQFGASAIEVEHILLGIIREDGALIRYALPFSGDTTAELRRDIESRIPSGPKVPTSVDLPLSTDAKRALVNALDESKRLGHTQVTTGDELLGILGVEQSIAAAVLRERGLGLDRAREMLRQSSRTEAAQPSPDPGQISGLVGKYTKKAALCFPISWQWAARAEAPTVGPEHLLLAIMECDQWLIRYFLPGGWKAFDGVVTELSAQRDLDVVTSARPLDVATLRALANADEEAKATGSDRVDTEHLLLGILAEDSRAALALRERGLDPERLRRDAFGIDEIDS